MWGWSEVTWAEPGLRPSAESDVTSDSVRQREEEMGGHDQTQAITPKSQRALRKGVPATRI